MAASIKHLCTLAVLLAMFGTCRAADDSSSKIRLAKIGKAATVLVEVKNRHAYGSAFCVHRSGLFLTNAHVAQGDVRIVLNPGLKTEKSYPARVIRSDKTLDLALLRVEGAKELHALSLGSDKGLEELMEVVTFGFPFGAAVAPGRHEYPAVSVNVGSITSLRRRDGRLNRIQLDAAVNPGSSGGPVLDSHGKVVGMIVSGFRGTGVNFAIPARTIADFLARPEVQFQPPLVNPGDIHKPARFEALVKPLLPPEKPLTVRLVLQSTRGEKRTYRMEAEGNRYHVTAAPVPPPPGPVSLRLSVEFEDGTLRGTTTDRVFQAGGHSMNLSEVRGMLLGSKSRVVRCDGQRLSGPISGLEPVPVQLGGQALSVDLHRAVKVEVTPTVPAGPVSCTLVVTMGGREILQQRHSLMDGGPIKNPGFEAGVQGWTVSTWSGSPAQYVPDTEIARAGWQSLRVKATKSSDTGCTQDVLLKPGHWYRFSGWVRTRGVQAPHAGLFGAFLITGRSGDLARSANHDGDTEWTQVRLTFQPHADGLTHICCFLAGRGQGTGTVWFDDLNLVEVEPPTLKAPADKARNLLVNGSFEEGPEIPTDRDAFIQLDDGSTALPGWIVSAGNINVVDSSFWKAADGKRSLDLNGSMPGAISQTLKTKKGQKYRVQFALAGSHPNAVPTEKKLQLRAGGMTQEFTFDTTGKTQKDMGWERKTWEFTAEADKTTLEFLSLTEGADGPALDDVVVVPISE